MKPTPAIIAEKLNVSIDQAYKIRALLDGDIKIVSPSIRSARNSDATNIIEVYHHRNMNEYTIVINGYRIAGEKTGPNMKPVFRSGVYWPDIASAMEKSIPWT